MDEVWNNFHHNDKNQQKRTNNAKPPKACDSATKHTELNNDIHKNKWSYRVFFYDGPPLEC